MTAAVERPDLANRTNLSKSVLSTAALCGQKAWFELRARRPFIPSEPMAFGSAVDAGVELLIKALRSGQGVSEAQLEDAIAFVAERDGIAVDVEEALTAVEAFAADVAPRYSWKYAATQETLRTVIDGLGECEGHPDVYLRGLGDDGFGLVDVFDVKTGKTAKQAAGSVELGFYALLLEDRAERVRTVGYWTWVRKKAPAWVVSEAEWSDEHRARTLAYARAYARARRADELLNAKADVPRNYSFPSGPAFAGLCATCQYAPANGGECELAAPAAVEEAA